MNLNKRKVKDRMDEKLKKIIENYQCPGCLHGSDVLCYKVDTHGIACGKHIGGTTISNLGKIFLGMPTGFNRLGPQGNETRIHIFDNFNSFKKIWDYDKFNIPVWKHRDEHENIIIRGISPRTNHSWIHIILEDCLDKINCFEITEEHMKEMD